MSIFASLPAPDDAHHEDGCAIYVEVSPGVFDFSGDPCSCGLPAAPLVYRGSHVLPSSEHERGGYVDIALIPGHITRDGRDDRPEDEDTPYPFLRFGVNNETVILEPAAVVMIRRTLGEWLESLRG